LARRRRADSAWLLESVGGRSLALLLKRGILADM
jgi:hypothetical protein